MKKLTIEEMRPIAKTRGGKCLSDHYIDRETKLLWECANGHQWKAALVSVKVGKWCPICATERRAKKLRLSIEELQKLADLNNGRLLSKEYINCKIPIKWECQYGHQWQATATSVKIGHWCPVCGGKTKKTIEDMQKVANQRGGKCLSKIYTDMRTKLTWKCTNGHRWEARPDNIKSGTWCPICAKKARAKKKKLAIEELQKIAVSRNGRLLSKNYINCKIPIRWECKYGHSWQATADNVKRGHWCPVCAGKRKKTIEDIRKMAKQRRGECLSKIYTNMRTKLIWQCAKGHQWEARPYNIKQGTWCPICARNHRNHFFLKEAKS